jgi:hypothetical protein
MWGRLEVKLLFYPKARYLDELGLYDVRKHNVEGFKILNETKPGDTIVSVETRINQPLDSQLFHTQAISNGAEKYSSNLEATC